MLSMGDMNGGAAIAAFRLHCALRNNGMDSKMLVRIKISTDQDVIELPIEMNDWRNQYMMLQQYGIETTRSNLTNTHFSLPRIGLDHIEHLSLLQNAQILNLHWISFFLTPFAIQQIGTLGKPMVWTLHDESAYTGGCHYTAGCSKYREGCEQCPQLREELCMLPATVLREKKRMWQHIPLTLVTPSCWLKQCVEQSALFREKQVEVIPNSIDTEIFTPLNPKEIKQQLNIPDHAMVLMFGSTHRDEKRKGYDILKDVLNRLVRENSTSELYFINVGQPLYDLHFIDATRILRPGIIQEPSEMARFYAASDLFLLPSTEDNLPNSLLEAMACGTCIAAFNCGGMPDIIKDGYNGFLAQPFSPDSLFEAIQRFLAHESVQKQCRENAIATILQNYTPEKQAQRYMELFKDLQSRNNTAIGNTSRTKDQTDSEKKFYTSAMLYAYRRKVDEQNQLQRLIDLEQCATEKLQLRSNRSLTECTQRRERIHAAMKQPLTVSAILCTHNPDPAIFDNVMEALNRQSFPHSAWQLILVDNDSDKYDFTPMVEKYAESMQVRLVHEGHRGLTYARCRGILEADAQLLVFVDDDNLLDADYFKYAYEISRQNEHIGAFSGMAEAIYEKQPTAWKMQFMPHLAIRNNGNSAIISYEPKWGAWDPIGAGMVVRKDAAIRFIEELIDIDIPIMPGRSTSSNQLTGGEDTLMARCANKLGYACSYQPALKLKHYIPARRTTIRYLARLMWGQGATYVYLQAILKQDLPEASIRALLQAAFNRFKSCRRTSLWSWPIAFMWDLGCLLTARKVYRIIVSKT